MAELKASIDEVRAQGKTESINRWEGEIVKLREAVNERQPITVKVDAPTVENKIELPEPKVPVVNVKAQAPGAVIENVVNVPEPKVVFETGTEDIEVLEREPDGKLKKLRKTKKK